MVSHQKVTRLMSPVSLFLGSCFQTRSIMKTRVMNKCILRSYEVSCHSGLSPITKGKKRVVSYENIAWVQKKKKKERKKATLHVVTF